MTTCITMRTWSRYHCITAGVDISTKIYRLDIYFSLQYMYLLQRKVDIWRMIETCSYRQEWVTVSCIQYTQGKNLVMKIPNWDFGLWHNELVVNFPEAVRRYLYNLISISCSPPLSAKVGCGDLKWCQEKWNHHWSCDATNLDTRHVSRVTMQRDNIYI